MIIRFIVVFVALVMGYSASAQKKVEVRPYTIATTVKKYKKDYPFIKPIEPLVSESIIAEQDIVYKTKNFFGRKMSCGIINSWWWLDFW